jgi:molybdopterin converting factor small subunit
VADGASITEVIAPYALPSALVHLVLVNGRYIAPPDRATHALQADDVLAIWPPIAGG